MDDKDKIERLSELLYNARNDLMYVKQLRPLIDQGGGYSKAISFELMSEYAVKWMEQEGLFDDHLHTTNN